MTALADLRIEVTFACGDAVLWPDAWNERATNPVEDSRARNASPNAKYWSDNSSPPVWLMAVQACPACRRRTFRRVVGLHVLEGVAS